MAILTVRRSKGALDILRKYRILLDGEEIGRVGERGTFTHHVSEGVHVLEARLDWCSSAPLRFSAGLDPVDVRVENAMHGWRLVFALWYVVFRRTEYLSLEFEQVGFRR